MGNEKKANKLLDSVKLFLKGLLMGAADIVPGISGGTIALITGIYDKLIESIDNISLKKGPKSINFTFFLPLALGIGTSFLILSNFISFLLVNYESLVYAFFFGLISASSVVIYTRITRKISLKMITATLIGATFSYFFLGIEHLNLLHSEVMIFISGFLAISAMLLPGISGAFILLFLGQYEHMLNALKNFTTEYVDIFIFMSGALISLFTFSRVIEWSLERSRPVTYSFLIGLMLGGLRLPVSIIELTGTLQNAASIIFAALFGLGVVLLLELKC